MSILFIKSPHFRACNARPREAPDLSAGGLQVARQQVTLKPSTTRTTLQRKKPPPADGGLDYSAGLSVIQLPSGRPVRCGP